MGAPFDVLQMYTTVPVNSGTKINRACLFGGFKASAHGLQYIFFIYLSSFKPHSKSKTNKPSSSYRYWNGLIFLHRFINTLFNQLNGFNHLSGTLRQTSHNHTIQYKFGVHIIKKKECEYKKRRYENHFPLFSLSSKKTTH